jgi:hypothetical protein
MDEIEQLKQKILQLENENIKKQEEIDEVKAFEYCFQQFLDIIQMSKKRIIGMSSESYIRAKQAKNNIRVEGVNEDIIPALESIYSTLDIINKRLLKLENN